MISGRHPFDGVAAARQQREEHHDRCNVVSVHHDGHSDRHDRFCLGEKAAAPSFNAWWGFSAILPSNRERNLDHEKSLDVLVKSFDRRRLDSYYPCVSDETPEDGGPEGHLFFQDPTEHADLYPDRIVRYGPRGGLVVERV
jgi:hypothetical protein